jgi:hypothetical protein
MTKIIINDNAFKTKKQALNYINKNIMTEGSFTDFAEAVEYLKENYHNIEVGLQCPYCGFTGDFCDFPDLIVEDEDNTKGEKEQVKLLEKLWTKGYNIVTCGHCGDVFIHTIIPDDDELYKIIY